MTQEKLARELGISKNHLSKLERDKATIHPWLALAICELERRQEGEAS